MNTDFGPLDHLGLLRFSGPDHIAFLQGQLSNDMRRLAVGTPLTAAYSTPQGRVLAVLRLLPTAAGTVAILPRELVAPTRERLRKFLLRSKAQIEELAGSLVLSGHGDGRALAAAGLPVPTEAQPCIEAGAVVVARVPGDPARHWVLAPEGGAQSTRDEDRWRLADIRAGLPQVYAATSELFVAQMLNLDLIDGISFSKGCYTGQEIIARTQHLGRIKRRMFRLSLPQSEAQIGAALRLADGRSGRLVELAPTPSGLEALAVLTLDATTGEADAPSDSAGVMTATELPLPYPLGAPAAAQAL